MLAEAGDELGSRKGGPAAVGPSSNLDETIWKSSPPRFQADKTENSALNRYLGAADQNADEKYANATDNNLESCAKKRRIHVTIANPANDQQLDCDD